MIKGELHLYFATGEQTRPQVIGYKCMNKEGVVISYDQIYDVKLGDKIYLIHPLLRNNGPFPINNNNYYFLINLLLIFDGKISAKYFPHKTNKSWGQIEKDSK